MWFSKLFLPIVGRSLEISEKWISSEVGVQNLKPLITKSEGYRYFKEKTFQALILLHKKVFGDNLQSRFSTTHLSLKQSKEKTVNLGSCICSLVNLYEPFWSPIIWSTYSCLQWQEFCCFFILVLSSLHVDISFVAAKEIPGRSRLRTG